MKTKNVTAQETTTIYPSYFAGSSIHDLMVKTTHILMTDSHFGEPYKVKLKIIPVHHPDKYTMGWVFKIGKVKLCTINFMEFETVNGKYNGCFLVWHIHFDVHFADLYKRVYGLPEWVKTKNDEDMFFRVA
jgi:hypothetical protein